MLQSCNDDETAKEGDVEGTWDVTGLNFDITINGESMSSFFTEDEAANYESFFTASFKESFEGSTIEFKSDGTYSSTDSDGNQNSGTWSLNSDGTKLTFDGGSTDEFSFDVMTSTKNSLVLGYSETDSSMDYDDDGVNDELKFTFDLTMSK
ncbi:MAG: lipocalin family protein [Bacteroidota bacterium]